jgi:uncharacterized alkaline shock family protein YloU
MLEFVRVKMYIMDDYFVNIRDISANIQGGVSSACFDEITNLVKQNAGADYSIPRDCVFVDWCRF